MTNLQKPTEPEYMKWDIDRLRKEYFKLSLQKSSLALQVIDFERREKAIERFFNSLDELREIIEENHA